jgi:hypothetical protein
MPELCDQDHGREGTLPAVGMPEAAPDLRNRIGLEGEEKPTKELRGIRPRKCAHCRTKFQPMRPFETWCSPECGSELAMKKITKAKANKLKKARKEIRASKEKLKSRGDYAREAQQAFNAYIRSRDEQYPCISCGRHHQGQYQAGHYRTVGANPELRFCELNVHKQCAPCNDHLHGNIVNYRIALVQRIGLERVEWLEGNHEPQHYGVEDLKEIKATYRAKLKAIKGE